jgi:long-subunit fatty acid transport protein
MRNRLSLLSLLAVAAIVPSSAEATPFQVYGAGTRAPSMGTAMTAEANGPDALWYNAASLVRAQSSVSFGLGFALDNAQILLKDRPAGYDVPDLGSVSPTLPSDQTLIPRVGTEEIGPFATVTLGAVSSLGSEKFRLGALAVFPVGGGASATHFVDERERLFSNQLYYELIGDTARRWDLEFGVAYQLIPQLSVGGGASILPAVSLRNYVYLPNPTDQEVVEINLEQKQGLNWGIHGGFLVEPTDWLRIGGSYRQAISFEIDGRNEVQLLGIDAEGGEYPVVQPLTWQPASSPAIFGLGTGVDIGKVTLALDLRYTRWSRWQDTHGADAGFDDTMAPHLGFEFAYSDGTRLRAGFGYEPTPVPDQVGRTNYVDNSRAMASIGAGHSISLAGLDLELGWFLQFQGLVARETDKDVLLAYPNCEPGVTALCDEVPNDLRDPRNGELLEGTGGLQTSNPGFPGFASGGWMAQLGVDLAWIL